MIEYKRKTVEDFRAMLLTDIYARIPQFQDTNSINANIQSHKFVTETLVDAIANQLFSQQEAYLDFMKNNNIKTSIDEKTD